MKSSELATQKQKYQDMVLKLNGEIEQLQSQIGLSVTGATTIEVTDVNPPATPPPKAKKASTKKKATTKGKAKGAVKKVRITKGAASTPSSGDVPEVEASTTTTKVKKKTSAKKKAKKAKVVEEVKATATAVATEKKPAAKKTGTASNEWGALSPSTLQRKTIKELQSYLDSKVRRILPISLRSSLHTIFKCHLSIIISYNFFCRELPQHPVMGSH